MSPSNTSPIRGNGSFASHDSPQELSQKQGVLPSGRRGVEHLDLKEASKSEKGGSKKWVAVAKNVALVLLGLALIGVGIALIAHGVPFAASLLNSGTSLILLGVASLIGGLALALHSGVKLQKGRSHKEVENQEDRSHQPKSLLQAKLEKQGGKMTLFQQGEYTVKYYLKDGNLSKSLWHSSLDDQFLGSVGVTYVDAKLLMKGTDVDITKRFGYTYFSWSSSTQSAEQQSLNPSKESSTKILSDSTHFIDQREEWEGVKSERSSSGSSFSSSCSSFDDSFGEEFTPLSEAGDDWEEFYTLQPEEPQMSILANSEPSHYQSEFEISLLQGLKSGEWTLFLDGDHVIQKKIASNGELSETFYHSKAIAEIFINANLNSGGYVDAKTFLSPEVIEAEGLRPYEWSTS